MIGREMQGDYYRGDWDGSCGEKVMLEIRNGSLGSQLVNFDLQIHEGEILGIGGLSHCGCTLWAKVLFGDIRLDSGSVLYTAAGRRGSRWSAPPLP